MHNKHRPEHIILGYNILWRWQMTFGDILLIARGWIMNNPHGSRTREKSKISEAYIYATSDRSFHSMKGRMSNFSLGWRVVGHRHFHFRHTSPSHITSPYYTEQQRLILNSAFITPIQLHGNLKITIITIFVFHLHYDVRCLRLLFTSSLRLSQAFGINKVFAII